MITVFESLDFVRQSSNVFQTIQINQSIADIRRFSTYLQIYFVSTYLIGQLVLIGLWANSIDLNSPSKWRPRQVWPSSIRIPSFLQCSAVFTKYVVTTSQSQVDVAALARLNCCLHRGIPNSRVTYFSDFDGEIQSTEKHTVPKITCKIQNRKNTWKHCFEITQNVVFEFWLFPPILSY